MEVTPITLRDVRVSSGIGANAHGRDTSPPAKENSKKDLEIAPRREMPVNLAEVRLAESLQRGDPSMDPVTAAKIAKQLLERPAPAHWETATTQSEQADERVDKLA